MKKRYIGAIDLGGTFIKMGLVEISGTRPRLIAKKNIPTPQSRSPHPVVRAITEGILSLQRSFSPKTCPLGAVGIGVPGIVDFDRGVVLRLTNLKGWSNFPLARDIKKILKVPVFVDNDANLMSLAENRIGASRGFKNAIGMTLGTGVGGGFILNGEVYRGEYSSAGEIGHMILNETGPACNCKGHACLESYVGNKRLKKEARILFGKDMSLEDVSRLASGGDRRAKKIWEKAGFYIGLSIVNLAHCFDPGVVVIGGGVSSSGKTLFDAIRETVFSRGMPLVVRRLSIRKARLGEFSGVLGAAILARESLDR